MSIAPYDNLGMSDDQRGIEYRLQRRLTAAIAELRSAIGDVNAGSDIVTIDATGFEDFLHDEVMSIELWNERIAEARHG